MKTKKLSQAVRSSADRERLTEIRNMDLVHALGSALETAKDSDVKLEPIATTKGCNLPHQDYVAPA
jgi:hypothetical protein